MRVERGYKFVLDMIKSRVCGDFKCNFYRSQKYFKQYLYSQNQPYCSDHTVLNTSSSTNVNGTISCPIVMF